MTRFTTLRRAGIEYGNQDFIDISAKNATSDLQPEDPGVTYLAITRGYHDSGDRRRFKAHVTVPLDAELVRWMARQLHGMADWIDKGCPQEEE